MSDKPTNRQLALIQLSMSEIDDYASEGAIRYRDLALVMKGMGQDMLKDESKGRA